MTTNYGKVQFSLLKEKKDGFTISRWEQLEGGNEAFYRNMRKLAEDGLRTKLPDDAKVYSVNGSEREAAAPEMLNYGTGKTEKVEIELGTATLRLRRAENGFPFAPRYFAEIKYPQKHPEDALRLVRLMNEALAGFVGEYEVRGVPVAKKVDIKVDTSAPEPAVGKKSAAK